MSEGFNNNKPIYLQIAEGICDKILQEEYKNASKILSIRGTALELEVNPNTVQRAYEWLQQNGIIFTKRGLGYFTDDEAKTKVMQLRKQQFKEDVLPDVFKNMHLLNMDLEEVKIAYNNYLKSISDEN